jgi:hypothetical protein
MSRIRTIKPEFFKHSGLFDAEQETGLPLRVAYAGLWTCCDREGRFKWRPRDLKLDVLPYDDCDFSRVLDALATRGFVVKYASPTDENAFFGLIPSWKAHQFINNKEPQSQIPEPLSNLDVDACLTREKRVDDASSTRGVKERKGKEENTREKRVNEEAENPDGFLLDGLGTDKKKKCSPSDEDVEKVRQAYPVKKAPGPAREAIKKAMTRLAARGESETARFLIARITEWKAARRRDEAAGRFVPEYPYPATWFNQERYDEEALQPAKNCVLPNGKLGTANELEAQTGWQVMRGPV